MKNTRREIMEDARPSKKGRVEDDEFDFVHDEELGIYPTNEQNQPVHRVTIRTVNPEISIPIKEIEQDSDKIARYICLGILVVIMFILLSIWLYPLGWSSDSTQPVVLSSRNILQKGYTQQHSLHPLMDGNK